MVVVHAQKVYHERKPIRNPFEKKEKYWGKVKAWKDREAARARGEHPLKPGQTRVGGGMMLAKLPTKHPSKIPPSASRPATRPTAVVHPNKVKTETGHSVVATNTRGASKLLSGQTLSTGEHKALGIGHAGTDTHAVRS